MKLTIKQLKQIIKEQVEEASDNEDDFMDSPEILAQKRESRQQAHSSSEASGIEELRVFIEELESKLQQAVWRIEDLEKQVNRLEGGL